MRWILTLKPWLKPEPEPSRAFSPPVRVNGAHINRPVLQSRLLSPSDQDFIPWMGAGRAVVAMHKLENAGSAACRKVNTSHRFCCLGRIPQYLGASLGKLLSRGGVCVCTELYKSTFPRPRLRARARYQPRSCNRTTDITLVLIVAGMVWVNE
jgi:hypothetical protein